MVDPKHLTAPNARAALSKICDDIPKVKVRQRLFDIAVLECTLNKSFALLTAFRQYCLDTYGEKSPFVAKIDEILPRDKGEQPKC